MPNLALISKRWVQEPPIIAKLVKYAGFGPLWATALTDHDEIWRGVVNHGCTLIPGVAPIREDCGNRRPTNLRYR